MSISKTIKVKVIKTYPKTEKIFPLDFETEIDVHVSDEDCILCEEYTDVKGNIIPAIVRLKGTVIDYTFKGSDGDTYCNEWLEKAIGVSYFTVFKKLD